MVDNRKSSKTDQQASDPRDSEDAAATIVDIESAIERITSNQTALRGYIRTLVRDAQQADDVLQETNMVLWRKMVQYDPNLPFLAWAYTIAYYQVLAWRQRCSRDQIEFLDQQLLTDLAEAASSQASSFDQRVLALRKCLGELPDRQRQLIESRYAPGSTVVAIAGALGRTVTAISVSLNRIRSKLLRCIEQRVAAQED
ncbi:sigma-70 family RNA polymerase sigma factor [Bremerella sp. JC770]|uniref:sigma-70 family RNA polymerase sigma factor n=1 Tax=Bremerella sp. JC770 TaxID=3232137 RepID=UPI0034582D04